MQQNDKNLCILFETECWLYISEELSPERKEFWDSHISSCTTCASHLESSRYVSSVYTENCTEDIPDTVFNKVIESLPVKKSFWDKCRPFFTEWKGYYAFTKIAFACVLLIAAFSKILLTDKPIPIKEMTAQVFKWDDDELSAKIEEVSKSVSVLTNDVAANKPAGRTWSKSIDGISDRIDSLKVKINY